MNTRGGEGEASFESSIPVVSSVGNQKYEIK